jgi:hypothetical protein
MCTHFWGGMKRGLSRPASSTVKLSLLGANRLRGIVCASSKLQFLGRGGLWRSRDVILQEQRCLCGTEKKRESFTTREEPYIFGTLADIRFKAKWRVEVNESSAISYRSGYGSCSPARFKILRNIVALPLQFIDPKHSRVGIPPRRLGHALLSHLRT